MNSCLDIERKIEDMDSAFDDAASGDGKNPKTVELIKPAAVVEHFQDDSGIPGTGVVAVLDELRANQPATGTPMVN